MQNKIKNLTAEVAEHAEVEMANSSGPGCRGKSDALSPPSRKVKKAKGLSRNDLCALCFLFFHPLVSVPGRSKGKEGAISIKGFSFFVFTEKMLCDLCALCG
jgi:hypothetical protein